MKQRAALDDGPPCNTASAGEAATYEELALMALRTHGQRITMPRLQVIRTLGESNRALSAYSVHDHIVDSGGRIDVVSVYRILGMLQELGLAHHIAVVDGYVRCTNATGFESDCQHLVCRECGCVSDVPLPSTAMKATFRQARTVGFQPADVRIEMLGTCSHCQEGGSTSTSLRLRPTG